MSKAQPFLPVKLNASAHHLKSCNTTIPVRDGSVALDHPISTMITVEDITVTNIIMWENKKAYLAVVNNSLCQASVAVHVHGHIEFGNAEMLKG